MSEKRIALLTLQDADKFGIDTKMQVAEWLCKTAVDLVSLKYEYSKKATFSFFQEDKKVVK